MFLGCVVLRPKMNRIMIHVPSFSCYSSAGMLLKWLQQFNDFRLATGQQVTKNNKINYEVIQVAKEIDKEENIVETWLSILRSEKKIKRGNKICVTESTQTCIIAGVLNFNCVDILSTSRHVTPNCDVTSKIQVMWQSHMTSSSKGYIRDYAMTLEADLANLVMHRLGLFGPNCLFWDFGCFDLHCGSTKTCLSTRHSL